MMVILLIYRTSFQRQEKNANPKNPINMCSIHWSSVYYIYKLYIVFLIIS